MKHNNKVRAENLLKTALERTHESNTRPAHVTNVFYAGRVVSVNDPEKKRRIQVRIPFIDDEVADSDLPWCNTLLPPFLHMLPVKDELVIVFLQNPWVKRSGRFYFFTVMAEADAIDETFDETIDLLNFANEGKR